MLVVSNCCSPRLLISLAMKLESVPEEYPSWYRQLAATLASTAAASAVAPAEETSGWAVLTVGLILSHIARECLARARMASERLIISALLSACEYVTALSRYAIALSSTVFIFVGPIAASADSLSP